MQSNNIAVRTGIHAIDAMTTTNLLISKLNIPFQVKGIVTISNAEPDQTDLSLDFVKIGGIEMRGLMLSEVEQMHTILQRKEVKNPIRLARMEYKEGGIDIDFVRLQKGFKKQRTRIEEQTKYEILAKEGLSHGNVEDKY